MCDARLTVLNMGVCISRWLSALARALLTVAWPVCHCSFLVVAGVLLESMRGLSMHLSDASQRCAERAGSNVSAGEVNAHVGS